jgi:hypothetical protein
MTIRELIAKLEDARQKGDTKWMARCPAHDDRNRSLSIGVQDDRLLIHCFGGCSFKEVVASLGVAEKDLFADRLQHRRKAPIRVSDLARDKALPIELLHQEGVFDLPGGGAGIPYRGTDGRVVIKRRTTLVAREGSIWPRGTRLLAYGEWRLADARRAGTLVLVEGESDCWTLWHHGFPALGLPGASSTRVLSGEHLAGIERVYVVREPDRGGERFVAGVAARLEALGFGGRGYEVRLPDAKDPNDLHRRDPDAFREAFQKALDGAPPLGGVRAPVGRPAAPRRPRILIGTDEHRVVDEAAAALGSVDSVYQRGGLLVHVVRDEGKLAGIIRPRGQPRIVPLGAAGIRDRVTLAAECYSVRQTSHGPVELPVHPPGWLASEIEARQSWPTVRSIEGVVESPVLCPDGTVLSTPGYHTDTGLLYISNADYPDVRDAATREDAAAAAATLLDLVCDFPFASAASRSAWIASLLTPLARFAFTGPAPLFLVDANMRGAGKTKLVDIVSIIVQGRWMSRSVQTLDDAEESKRMTAIALLGERMVLMDNVEHTLGSTALNTVLTATIWEGRLLGRSEMLHLPLIAAWYATGNNVQLRPHGFASRVLSSSAARTRVSSSLLRAASSMMDHASDVLNSASARSRGSAWCVDGSSSMTRRPR